MQEKSRVVPVSRFSHWLTISAASFCHSRQKGLDPSPTSLIGDPILVIGDESSVFAFPPLCKEKDAGSSRAQG